MRRPWAVQRFSCSNLALMPTCSDLYGHSRYPTIIPFQRKQFTLDRVKSTSKVRRVDASVHVCSARTFDGSEVEGWVLVNNRCNIPSLLYRLTSRSTIYLRHHLRRADDPSSWITPSARACCFDFEVIIARWTVHHQRRRISRRSRSSSGVSTRCVQIRLTASLQAMMGGVADMTELEG